MSNLDLTKPVRCKDQHGNYLDVKIIYSGEEKLVGLAEGFTAASTWTVENLWCVSSHNFSQLENYIEPIKVKKTVYLFESKHENGSYRIRPIPAPLYNEKTIASAEVEFTIGEFAE
jgi:hypothetical protein